MKRKANAEWLGSGKEGKGHLTTQSTVLNQTQYSFSSRFEEGIGTNPEELIAAAHAGCFTMKLSFNLGAANFTPEKLDTTCTVNFEDGAVVESHLYLIAQVKGISEEKFAEVVNDAKENCPISKLLNTKITLEYKLEN
ncbi:MAG: peroxiredoxin [Crocinitomicaceae bacterium]|jgi:osmotically inducible protein OsmC|nr:peroxiredoxin [Crocinitomicaceae bacterium]